MASPIKAAEALLATFKELAVNNAQIVQGCIQDSDETFILLHHGIKTNTGEKVRLAGEFVQSLQNLPILLKK